MCDFICVRVRVVCVYVNIIIYLYVCALYVHVCMCTYVCLYVCCVFVCVRVCVCVVCIYVCVRCVTHSLAFRIIFAQVCTSTLSLIRSSQSVSGILSRLYLLFRICVCVICAGLMVLLSFVTDKHICDTTKIGV